MADPPPVLESRGLSAALDGSSDLAGFAASVNAKARIKGLEDTLNPGILDPGKLRALASALDRQSPEVRSAMSGKRLIAASPVLGVLAIEPTAADAFGPAYRIAIQRVDGDRVQVRGNAPIDPALARTRAAAAKAATEAADKAVRAVEKGRADPDGLDLGGVRWRRAQAAVGWRIVARAWHGAAPDDPAAARALEAAEKAAEAFDMPTGGLR